MDDYDLDTINDLDTDYDFGGTPDGGTPGDASPADGCDDSDSPPPAQAGWQSAEPCRMRSMLDEYEDECEPDESPFAFGCPAAPRRVETPLD